MANDKQKSSKRDYPLAPTPQPKVTADTREAAYGKDMQKYGYVKDTTVEQYKKK